MHVRKMQQFSTVIIWIELDQKQVSQLWNWPQNITRRNTPEHVAEWKLTLIHLSMLPNKNSL